MGRNFALEDSHIAIVGRACRLPGASSVQELWELLHAGRCAVSAIPEDRWPLERHRHPRLKEPGRSYTWAAGVLPDIWGFDPAVFRISPREAQQMDPQQRLLLELVFEACEDAGFAPSKLAGSGPASTSAPRRSTIHHRPARSGGGGRLLRDRQHALDRLEPHFLCLRSARAEPHGRHRLLVVARRAPPGAAGADRSGEVDTALVGGVNVLVSPFGFISFSQATMLSPTGLCRPFSAEADGYVRAEGGVVLVLKTLKKARSPTATASTR